MDNLCKKKMKKIFVFLAGLVLCLHGFSQKTNNDLKSLAQAERDFSAMFKTEGFQKSFLHFFDPEVVFFAQGQQVDFRAHVAKSESENTDEDHGYLAWEPIYADISASGDFGYTTGPLYLFKSKKDNKPAGYMYYSSVWKKNENKEWKVIMDLGVGIPGAPLEEINLKTSARKLKSGRAVDINEEKQSIDQLDQQLCGKLNATERSFDAPYLSEEVRIHRMKSYPCVGIGAIAEVKESDRTHHFEFMDSRMASSGDMGFTYGKVRVKENQDSKGTEYNAIYYRVWKKENNKDWKIVLDVIGTAG